MRFFKMHHFCFIIAHGPLVQQRLELLDLLLASTQQKGQRLVRQIGGLIAEHIRHGPVRVSNAIRLVNHKHRIYRAVEHVLEMVLGAAQFLVCVFEFGCGRAHLLLKMHLMPVVVDEQSAPLK